MPGFQSIPLTVDQHAIRLEPFEAQAASSGTTGARTSVDPRIGTDARSGVVANAAVDGELDDGDIAELQSAAASGDKEAFDLLSNLGIPLGVAAGAAGLYGATRGGLALYDSVMRNRGEGGMFPDQARTTPMTMPPSRRLTGPQTPQTQAIPQITDQTGGRFNQPALVEPAMIEDMRTPYEKSGGKLPTGEEGSRAIGAQLRRAAQAARRR